MVHGILQFTPSIAFRYVLHRCESRDIRCRESFSIISKMPSPPPRPETGGWERALAFRFLDAICAGVRCDAERTPVPVPPAHVARLADRAPSASRLWGERGGMPPLAPVALIRVRGSFCWAGFDNDPSAGSPTETLLRLLLPLNDKVQWTSRDVAGGEPPTSPRSEHFTGPFNR